MIVVLIIRNTLWYMIICLFESPFYVNLFRLKFALLFIIFDSTYKNKGRRKHFSERYYYNIYVTQMSHKEDVFRQKSVQKLDSHASDVM